MNSYLDFCRCAEVVLIHTALFVATATWIVRWTHSEVITLFRDAKTARRRVAHEIEEAEEVFRAPQEMAE